MSAAKAHPAALPELTREGRARLAQALQPARAAFWLLDQMVCGDLYVLSQADAPDIAADGWRSKAAVAGLSRAEVYFWLEELAVEALDQALAELSALIEPDEVSQVPTAVPARRAAAKKGPRRRPLTGMFQIPPEAAAR